MKDVIALLVPFGFFAMVIAIIWLFNREKVARARMRTEVQKELLAKFTTGTELTQFLSSEGSNLLWQEIPATKLGSKQRVIKLVVAGIIVLALGAAFLFAGTDREAAAIFISVGAGILLSALASHFLAKRMGLYEQSASGRTSRP